MTTRSHPSHRSPRIALLSLWAVVALTLAGCAGAVTPISQNITPAQVVVDVPPGTSGDMPAQLTSDLPPALPSGTATTIRVPEDYKTVQEAVDAAVAGQIISIAPGVYHEGVRITKPHLTVRGRDRNGVIFDGRQSDGSYLGNAFFVGHGGDDTILENMTARYYIGNGFYWDDITGYRGSYLTAINNGDYGIYAFNSRRGQLDHSYASGSPDSGFYIGQCYPCDALITHVISENNGLGYSGTNAGGNLVIRDSVWRYNYAGILPNSLDSEKLAPQHETTIVHNLVYDNNNDQAPAFVSEAVPIGIGISIAGGQNNLIADNIVEGHSNYGILIVGNIDDNLYTPSGNTVINNTVSSSGVADLALALPAGPDNCFSGNTISHTIPALLQQTNACGSLGAHMSGGDLGGFIHMFSRFVATGGFAKAVLGAQPSQKETEVANRWKTYPEPTEKQPTMPSDLLNGSVRPIFTESWTSGTIDVADPHATTSTKAVAAVGLSSLLEIFLGFYSYLLPIALYSSWVGIALWDLAKRDQAATGDGSASSANALKPAARYGWVAAVIGIPLLGAIAYYIFGKSTLSRGFRWMMIGGALGIWLVATVVLMALAGAVG